MVATNEPPVDVELKKPRRGEGCLRILLIAVGVLVALVLAVTVAFLRPSDRSVDATSEVTIGQIERVAGQSPIAVPVTVRNTTDDERDYVIDVNSTSPDGTQFYASSGILVERVPAGGTGTASVGFFGA
ncbi:MAG: hypothetical protein QG597_4882, partial [Actinomycetota bacterium]|nr:hypothetical protein [Actinomycetota bacterium]